MIGGGQPRGARHTPSVGLILVARGRKRLRSMPTRRYTEEQFRTALEDPAVRTMADLCRALGIVPRGANYETVRAYAARMGLDLDRRLALHHLA